MINVHLFGLCFKRWIWRKPISKEHTSTWFNFSFKNSQIKCQTYCLFPMCFFNANISRGDNSLHCTLLAMIGC